MSHFGPTLPFSEELHAKKYRGEGEGFREAMNRVSSALADGHEHFHKFRDILLDMRFLPGGRIQAAIGSTKNVTPYNCFVSGTIEDSFVDGKGSIMARAMEAAATMRMGGGIGYDFSTLRPRGDLIKKLMSLSTGPVSFMEIFNAVCLCTASSGHRRGAQMGVLKIDHPDIEEFVRAKQNETRLRGFNISVAVTDEFMECLMSETPFKLRFGGQFYREIDPVALWETIMRATWDWAEPGVLFIDRINEMNNLYYCETIAATNPCAEQPLPPYGACLLGSVNLTKYVKRTPTVVAVGREPRHSFDFDQLLEDLPWVVRAMDNVVDKASYPLYEQEKEAKSKRRMGIGVTGMANALEALGLPYGSPEFVAMEGRVLGAITTGCYRASAGLAAEKGPFKLYSPEQYLSGKFIKSLDEETRHLIGRHGIRNSHLTSIAPTGTISLCADNVSSGIEPVFSYEIERTVMEFSGPRVEKITDYGLREFGVRGKRSSEVSVHEHLAVLSEAYRHVDSAVSKTCNVPSDTPWDRFKAIYTGAWESGCKGCTTYQVGGMRAGVLVARDGAEEPPAEGPVVAATGTDGAACYYDPETGSKTCDQ